MVSTSYEVLGIAGSPRRGGNTDLLLERALAGAAARGARIRFTNLCELRIEPCRHCDGCRETGRCVIEDDMQGVHQDLRAATHIVLATPVFFMGPTAQVKGMIDRCQALWALKYKLGQKPALVPGAPRRGLLLAAGGSRMSKLFEPTLAIVKSWFVVLDFFFAGEVTISGVDGPGAVRDQPTALAAAWTAGQKLVG